MLNLKNAMQVYVNPMQMQTEWELFYSFRISETYVFMIRAPDAFLSNMLSVAYTLNVCTPTV